MQKTSSIIKQFLTTGIFSLVLLANTGAAHHTDTHFEDDSTHHIVYQLDKEDPGYIYSILFSAGELLRKYGDDVEIVIAVCGSGLHLLAKDPVSPIPEDHQQKAASLAAYGIAFHACGDGMKALELTEQDMLDFVKFVPIGVADIMELQARGFAYVAL